MTYACLFAGITGLMGAYVANFEEVSIFVGPFSNSFVEMVAKTNWFIRQIHLKPLENRAFCGSTGVKSSDNSGPYVREIVRELRG